MLLGFISLDIVKKKKKACRGKVWHNFACEGVLAACTVKLSKSVRLVCNTYGSASHACMRFSSPGHTPLELSPQHTSRYVSGNNLIRLVPSIAQQMENCYISVALASLQGQPGHMGIWKELSAMRVNERGFRVKWFPKVPELKIFLSCVVGWGEDSCRSTWLFSNNHVS